ncbi:YhgE/Pip domain-containing protein [Lysinibacillus sphaericus]|uniref:YhgE/Pip domain-containing protein n=1 Tax=Lysinibacillus sphaericus TaxID=1421 RepID=A0A544U8L2_LYSSH|nr:YhgE/Pip domain-containing protein [Lysinibacillus sp. SDF0037]TQR28449.1 YhgE/Pip domain-containing protein [Lysinibacillus sp. SDF0037]
MKGLQLVLQDLVAIWKHKHGRIALIFLTLVPLIYAGFFLAGYWDPYGHLDKLPVAVVNLDEGANIDNESIHIGDDFVAQLKKGKELNFQFVSAKTAKKGLEAGDYYMIIKIPKDFSKNITTVMDKTPKPAKLLYEVNPGKNYVASQITTTAIEKMKTKINANVTKFYSETILTKFQDVSTGFTGAGTGAQKLYNGLVDAQNGSSKLTDGIQSLNEGAQKLKTGSTELSAGQKSLSNGVTALTTGSNSLHNGLQQLTEGERSLQSGMGQVSQGITNWSIGNTKLVQGQEKAASTARNLEEQLTQYVKDHPEAKQDQKFQQIMALSEALSEAETTLKAGQEQVDVAAKKIATGQTSLQTGMETFGNKITQATEGAKRLQEGTTEIASGFTKWVTGYTTLNTGITTLANGISHESSGLADLHDGLSSLVTGSNELATKLNDAAEKTSNLQNNDSTSTMFAQPIELVESELSNVPNYGAGIAPYFLSLALFVGGIMAANILPLGRRELLKVTGTVHFINKLGLVYVVGLIQTLIVDLVVLLGFKLTVASVPLFILSSIIVSLTFMTFILMLIILFGNLGKLLAVTLLVFQLATCGGTFPGELENPMLARIGGFLPMAHSLKSFQEVVSLGGWSNLITQGCILLIYLLLAFIIGWISSHIQHREPSNVEIVK